MRFYFLEYELDNNGSWSNYHLQGGGKSNNLSYRKFSQACAFVRGTVGLLWVPDLHLPGPEISFRTECAQDSSLSFFIPRRLFCALLQCLVGHQERALLCFAFPSNFKTEPLLWPKQVFVFWVLCLKHISFNRYSYVEKVVFGYIRSLQRPPSCRTHNMFTKLKWSAFSTCN